MHITTNICTRCGKERVKSRVWKEKIVSLLGKVEYVTITENICPDSTCQEIVEKALEAQRKKTADHKLEREERMKTNLRNRNSKKH